MAAADGAGAPRVLIIDDEAAFARMLQDYLEMRGCQVETASGGLEGFRQANRREFDLITVDINMPGVNGVEALRGMQIVGQPARVVVISGYLSEELAADCRAAGVAAVLSKPVDLARLGEIAGDLLGKRWPRTAGAPDLDSNPPATTMLPLEATAPRDGRGTEMATPKLTFVQATCAGCGKSLRLPANLAGRKTKCYHCHAVVSVPAAAAGPDAAGSAPPPPPPATPPPPTPPAPPPSSK